MRWRTRGGEPDWYDEDDEEDEDYEPDPYVIGLARKAFAQVCVSREFTMFAERKESPIADWLRALARSEHRRHGASLRSTER